MVMKRQARFTIQIRGLVNDQHRKMALVAPIAEHEIDRLPLRVKFLTPPSAQTRNHQERPPDLPQPASR